MNQTNLKDYLKLIFLLIIIGLVSYFVFFNKSVNILHSKNTVRPTNTTQPTNATQETNTQQNNLTNNPVSSPIPTKDVISGWKEYKSDLGFTVKYPADWQYVNLFSEKVCFGKDVKIDTLSASSGQPARCLGDYISIWAQAGVTTNIDDTIKLRQEANPNVEMKRLVIDGAQSVTFYDTKTAETFFSSKNGTGYIVNMVVENSDNFQNLRRLYESMLSSFKFLP